jgi:hypothetical protein
MVHDHELVTILRAESLFFSLHFADAKTNNGKGEGALNGNGQGISNGNGKGLEKQVQRVVVTLPMDEQEDMVLNLTSADDFNAAPVILLENDGIKRFTSDAEVWFTISLPSCSCMHL